MRFNTHSNLAGSHALLSPSNYHWTNYDDQKLEARVFASFAAKRGTDLHELAQRMIRLGVKLPKTTETLNEYVNDAIGFRMTPEVMLFYSMNCYGTTDAIGFSRNKLRIHDLKTGITQTSVTQLEVYAALFCLEYDVKPIDIEIELRIYQNDEVRVYEGDVLSITRIMDQIVYFDKKIDEMRLEAYG
jgi:hypothetical protein